MAERIADDADLAVDELKRRARRRLVGAIVLALAAAVILPLLLEKEPKPLGDDVSVQIPPVDEGRFINRLTGRGSRRPPRNPTASRCQRSRRRKRIRRAPRQRRGRDDVRCSTRNRSFAGARPRRRCRRRGNRSRRPSSGCSRARGAQLHRRRPRLRSPSPRLRPRRLRRPHPHRYPHRQRRPHRRRRLRAVRALPCRSRLLPTTRAPMRWPPS